MKNGKGSRRRCMRVSQERYFRNWNKIFKEKKTKTNKKKSKKED